MDESRRLRVAQLAQAESRIRQRFEALGFRNTSTLTAEEREALDVDYALARADWYEALDNLRAAIEPSPSVIKLIRATGREYVPYV